MNYKKHYVYEITNITNDMKYVGCRSCNCKPKEDIGIKYFSSSKDKIFILEQKEYPNNFEYKVLQIFRTRKEAIQLEIDLHVKYSVGRNKKYYNKAKQTSTGWDTTGTTASTETREKQSKAGKGRIFTEEHCNNISLALKGKPKSEEHCQNVSIAMIGRKLSVEHCENISKANLGHEVLNSTRQKISVGNKGKPKSKEHCENMSAAKKKWFENLTEKEHTEWYEKKYTEATSRKMSEAKKGVVFSEEHCKNISKCQIGKRWFVNNKNETTRQLPNSNIILEGEWQQGRRWK